MSALSVWRDLRYLATEAAAVPINLVREFARAWGLGREGGRLGADTITHGPNWADSVGDLSRAWAAGRDYEPAAQTPRAGVAPSANSALGSRPESHIVIAAAIGLREFAALPTCEAPIYWAAIADQLDFRK